MKAEMNNMQWIRAKPSLHQFRLTKRERETYSSLWCLEGNFSFDAMTMSWHSWTSLKRLAPWHFADTWQP